MSSFIVEDKVINSVIAYLGNSRGDDAISRAILAETGYDIQTREGRQSLGVAMFELNCNAVEQRYGKGEAQKFRELNYEYSPEIPPTSIQAYKWLNCWSYQCAEGDIPESSLLYGTMERVASILAHHIVTNLSAYDKAAW